MLGDETVEPVREAWESHGTDAAVTGCPFGMPRDGTEEPVRGRVTGGTAQMPA
jgi:hypothetical protein